MAISPQRLTIYLYSAHRAVIFAIAQLSCHNIFSTAFNRSIVQDSGLGPLLYTWFLKVTLNSSLVSIKS